MREKPGESAFYQSCHQIQMRAVLANENELPSCMTLKSDAPNDPINDDLDRAIMGHYYEGNEGVF